MPVKSNRPNPRKPELPGYFGSRATNTKLRGGAQRDVTLNKIRLKGLLELSRSEGVHRTKAYRQALGIFANSPAPGHEALLLDFLIAAKRGKTRLVDTHLEFSDAAAREVVGNTGHAFLFSEQHPNRLHLGAELLGYLRRLSRQRRLGIE